MASTLIDRLDGLSSSAAIKGPARVATTANIVLSGLQTIDGVALVSSDRVLVKDQTSGLENGIYVVDTGPWRRSRDFAGGRDVVQGTQVKVSLGTVNGNTVWSVSSATNNVGTSALSLQKLVGNSAALNVGTTSGTVASGNDSRIVGAAQKASNLSDLPDVAAARTNIGAAQLRTDDAVITVPGNYATVEAAMDALAYALLWPSSTMTIRASGRFPAGSGNPTKIIRGPYIGRVRIVGDTPIDIPILGSAVSGSAGNWSVTYQVASLPAGFAIGDVGPAFGMTSLLHWGAWKVTAIPDTTHFTVKNTTYSTAPPAGQTGTFRWFPTQLVFNGKTAFSAERGQLVNVALVGDETSVDSFGVICKEWDYTFVQQQGPLQQGTIQLSNVAINGFGAEGARANYGGAVHCYQVFVSNCGNNGFMQRENAQVIVGSGCVSSGNGFRNIVGGNNGFLSQNGGSMLLFGPKAIGNRGDGLYSRSSASILVDNSAPASAYGNLYDYHAGQDGFLQAEGALSESARTHSYFNEGRMVVTGAISLNAAVNGFLSVDLAYMNASGGAQVTGAGANGFVALDGAKTYAPNAKVVSCGATPYYADKKGWTTMTGKTGLTGSFPTANTAPTGIAGYVQD